MLNQKSILVTGGTGSFGHTFVPMTLEKYNPKRLVIYSRDEMKQWEMAKLYKDDERVRFFIGDVRDKDRLARALTGIDYVVHAAATKIVPTAEYNPFECVKTNVTGAMNLIDACIDKGVKRVVALSTDKASSPVNLYGATKLAGERAIQEVGGRYLIFRTSWVYGPHGKNFLLTMLRLASERDCLSIVDDQLGSPTSSIELARATHAIISIQRSYQYSGNRFCQIYQKEDK